MHILLKFPFAGARLRRVTDLPPEEPMLKKLLVGAAVLAVAGLGVSTSSSTAAATPQAVPTTHRLCAVATHPGENTCFAVARSETTQPARTPEAARPFTTPAGYLAFDLQQAYSLDEFGGQNELVAIVDAYGDPNLASDLNAYRSENGLAPCTTANGCFHIYNQNGQSSPLPAGNVGWAGETSLDVDMVSATCYSCKIDVVQANSASNGDLFTAVNAAANLGAKFISLSWGGSEFSGETNYDSYLNHPGVAITVSTGDAGYGVEYPSSSPNVTAVGGTSLYTDSSLRGFHETAWSGAGSGCSAYEAKPSFQHDTGCARRAVADVSAIADPNTGVAYYDTYGSGGWGVAGGTSVAAPIIAGVYAQAGLPTPNAAANSYPYNNPGYLNDVTTGSNGSCGGSYLCTATSGYDGPTGLGTPSGTSSFWAPGATGGKAGYTGCGAQNGPCQSDSIGTVAYGVNGAFRYGGTSSDVTCSDGTFGDPAVGSVKACYALDGSAQYNTPPPGYTSCASENGTCSFSGSASVAFGANGQFNFRGAAGSIACNNSTFGDPIGGTAKACYYRTLTAAGGPSGSTLCASETGTCSFAGTHLVAFGANGQFDYRFGIGSLGCNTVTFGDPTLNVAKKCYVL